ncbi:carbohydrate ABC transporter membrane protein 2, CUT1 family [Seinonella peptonophila]|uniref:Carbohydrate ABC transporter membrane protein 2, CUT1 family n=1 Tax=Seinonella peptonophila TaxID=112248 RepID=A0A1M4T437_9BACL|nr:carbohydrate ABC transporter permease [Seinonella peptonophila]SHE39246.1 carbohydrate ABC transporter membrane protein 2, CUT1 family [Seinonella peptonophila]
MQSYNNRWITIFALVLGIIMVIPIYMMVLGSLRSAEHVFDITLLPTQFQLSNYQEVVASGFLRSVGNSLFISAAVTVIAMLFHAMSGYALARLNFPGRKYIFAWMLSTLMIPLAVIMIPLFMITKNLGMANSYVGLIVPSIFNAYGVFLFRQFYLNFPKELEEAAYMEGSSIAGTFFRIVLPLSKSVIIPLTVGFFLANWNAYLWPLIINQKEQLWVVQVALANAIGGGYTIPWNFVLAASVIAALPTMLLFFLLQRQIVDGIKMSGIK